MIEPHRDTASHDKHFYDTFMFVLGGLAIVTVILIFAARAIAAHTQGKAVKEDPKVQLAIGDRLAPVGHVAVSGADNSAIEAPKAQTQAAAVDLPGEKVFSSACVACHGLGVAGAPKFGDKAVWKPRIAQGTATLYEHALKGFQGKAGMMPAKGGNAALTDKSVTNAVDYIVAAGK